MSQLLTALGLLLVKNNSFIFLVVRNLLRIQQRLLRLFDFFADVSFESLTFRVNVAWLIFLLFCIHEVFTT